MTSTTAQSPLNAQQLSVVQSALRASQHQPGPLLEILHAIQDALGFVPPAVVPVLADGLNLSRAEVHGVLSFYHHFRSEPPGLKVVQLCRAEACQAMGADSLAAHASRRLGTALHSTSADGRYSLEPVYCLGNCARAPAMRIDGELHGCVTPQRFDEILDDGSLTR